MAPSMLCRLTIVSAVQKVLAHVATRTGGRQ